MLTKIFHSLKKIMNKTCHHSEAEGARLIQVGGDDYISEFAGLLQEGASVHFHSDFFDAEFGRAFLKNILLERIIPGSASDGDIFCLENNGTAVGYACTQIPDQESVWGGFSRELLLISVVCKFRRCYHGKTIVSEVLKRYRGQNLLVRCMPESIEMIGLLKSLGFVRISMPGSSNVNFYHPNID